MCKLGIFGGTFNPPHNGHIHLVEQVIRQMGLDKILVIPTNIPPHKEAKLPSEETRLRMAHLAFGEIEKAEVCDIELKEHGKSYTVDTLENLHRLYPECEWYFITGSDMFLSVESWHRAQDIFKLCTVVGAARDHSGISKLQEHAKQLKKRYGADTRVLCVEPMEMSSTEVRERIKAGLDTEKYLPYGLRKYIDDQGMYR